MITARQRSYLKSLANPMKPLVHIGKDGITDAVLAQIDEILKAHEMVKVAILDTAMINAREAAIEVCESVRAEFVQAIGNRFTVYKKNHEDPKIDLSQRGIHTKNAVIKDAQLNVAGLKARKRSQDSSNRGKSTGSGKKTAKASSVGKGTRGNSRGK